METFVVGASNQLAYNAALYVAEFPGAQYNPLFIHGNCGLGKTHLLQGLCKRFIDHHPTKRWMYLTGEEFTNEFLVALRANKLDAFRRKVREVHDRLASASASDIGNLIDLQPVQSSAIGKDQDITVRIGYEHVRDRIFILRLHADPAFAASPLIAVHR